MALKHPIRRQMLRELSKKGAVSFSDLMRLVKLVDTGTFGFHLKALEALIKQNGEGKYCLSELGKVAHQLIAFIEESEEVKSVVTEVENEAIKPLFQLSVEGTQDLKELRFGYWSNVAPKEKEKRKKVLDFIRNKLNEVERSEPKPVCEIQIGVTPEGMTTIGKEWLTELSPAEKKKYIDLLIDKLKFMKEKEEL